MDQFGKNILEIMDNFSLKDVCRVMYPSGFFFTFLTGNSKSRIDKIIVSKSFDITSYYHEICYLSDHVIITSALQIKGSKYEKGYGVWKNNVSIFKNKVFAKEFEKLWNF